jgi:hypothetical protein
MRSTPGLTTVTIAGFFVNNILLYKCGFNLKCFDRPYTLGGLRLFLFCTYQGTKPGLPTVTIATFFVDNA